MKIREILDRFIIEPFKKTAGVKKIYLSKDNCCSFVSLFVSAALITGVKLIPSLMSSDDDSVSYKNNDLIEIDIELSDFLIPEEITSLDKFSWVPYRSPRKKWSREEIDEFWINPEETVREAAEKKK